MASSDEVHQEQQISRRKKFRINKNLKVGLIVIIVIFAGYLYYSAQEQNAERQGIEGTNNPWIYLIIGLGVIWLIMNSQGKEEQYLSLPEAKKILNTELKNQRRIQHQVASEFPEGKYLIGAGKVHNNPNEIDKPLRYIIGITIITDPQNPLIKEEWCGILDAKKNGMGLIGLTDQNGKKYLGDEPQIMHKYVPIDKIKEWEEYQRRQTNQ